MYVVRALGAYNIMLAFIFSILQAADQSYDFITNSKTYQPTDTEVLSHDTACAGIIGAARNNLCGVGIAYDSKVAMLRYKIKKATNNVAHMIREPAAFNYHYQDISIYSCSFGPKDDGKTIFKRYGKSPIVTVGCVT